MTEAVYVVGVSRAMQGGMDDHDIRWNLPLSRGWAYYHAGRLFDGEPMVWPDHRLRRRSRWWDAVRKRFFTRGAG